MENYSNLLNENCIRTKNIFNNLENKNKLNCYNSNNLIKKKICFSNNECKDVYTQDTQRNTINNKWTCYNDIGKEIVSKMDADSNCSLYTRLFKKEISNNKTQNLSYQEGPDFINKFDLEPANLTNSIPFYFIQDTPQDIDKNLLINKSYSDISINSDPSYLYQMASIHNNFKNS